MRCRRWRTKALIAIALLILGLSPNTLKAQATPGAHKQLQKVTFSYPAISMTWLPLKVAVDKGFFADEGLEPNLIFMRGNLGTVALSNGDIDFVLNITSALQGALQGLGLKLVAALNTRPLSLWWFGPKSKLSRTSGIRPSPSMLLDSVKQS